MNRSQGPGQGPLAPDAGQEVGPGAGRRFLKPGGDALPKGAGAPRAAPALPPRGPHPLGLPSRWAGVVGGAREQALPAPLLPRIRVRGAAGPGRPCPLRRRRLLPALTCAYESTSLQGQWPQPRLRGDSRGREST